MEFVEAGVSLSFEVTFDSPSLFVAMEVYDDSGTSPAFVTLVAMENFSGNSYRGKFTAEPGKSYLFNKSVYTDGSYTTRDSTYAQGSESIRADDFAGLFLNAVSASYQEPGSVGAAIGGGGGGGSMIVIGAILKGIITTPAILGIVKEIEIGVDL